MLRDLGYVGGQNIRFEFRSDEGQMSRLPELAAVLVALIGGDFEVIGQSFNFEARDAPSPQGGLAHARPDDLEAFPSGLGHAASGTTYLPTR